MFTWRHLLWLVICAGLIWAAVHAFDKKRPGLDRVLTTALIAAVISEIVKMAGVIELVPSQNGELLLPYLPKKHCTRTAPAVRGICGCAAAAG